MAQPGERPDLAAEAAAAKRRARHRRLLWALLAFFALAFAAGLVASWFLWRPVFVWVLLLGPVAILGIGLAVQAFGILSRGEELP